MGKIRKNYYKKPVGSVAVLGYYVVMPFYRKAAHLSSLQEIDKNAKESVCLVIKKACCEIQASFIVAGQLFDDGVVEAHPIINETHVTLYLKLPATISVHSALSQIRIHTAEYLRMTPLKRYRDTYASLFKTVYLAFCMPADPSPVQCLRKELYGDYMKAFFIENALEPALISEVEDKRKAEFRRKAFMSDAVTHYV